MKSLRFSPLRTMSFAALLVAMFLMLLALPASAAIDQAMPSQAPAPDPHRARPAVPAVTTANAALLTQDRTIWAKDLKLDEFRRLAIQHDSQLKIIDSWARQSLKKMTRISSRRGQDPVFTAMDMMLRPQAWEEVNFIYIQAIPIRQQLSDFFTGAERERLLREGTVSPKFLRDPKTQSFLEQHAARDQRLAEAINLVLVALNAFDSLEYTFAVLPPADPSKPWNLISDLLPNLSPGFRDGLARMGNPIPPDSAKLAGYTETAADEILTQMSNLAMAWRTGDIAKTNAALARMSETLPLAQPQTYPDRGKRNIEVIYNATYSGTLLCVFLYMAAMVMMLLYCSGTAKRIYGWGLGIYILAVVIHGAAIAVRWYLAGRIPIQNQFESWMGAAFLGCLAGLVLELFKRKGFFAMAMAKVGFAFTTACFVMPFVVGSNMGESVGKTSGILMTYWLWIHVNVVIFSYALIAASAVLGLIYLTARLWHWISPIETAIAPAGTQGGGSGASVPRYDTSFIENGRRDFLAALDGTNVIIMRLAFLFLGTGIVLGAVWADVSWGRPWGWDPKETFALVTWLVYLILIHVRFVSPASRGTATAWLSVLGCGIMLFNWIGVNYMLVGLHSYA